MIKKATFLLDTARYEDVLRQTERPMADIYIVTCNYMISRTGGLNFCMVNMYLKHDFMQIDVHIIRNHLI